MAFTGRLIKASRASIQTSAFSWQSIDPAAIHAKPQFPQS